MLYLVEGKISISHYMQDEKEVESKTRLVDATSEQEAEQKFIKHFEDHTSEYSVYYSASVYDVSEVIS